MRLRGVLMCLVKGRKSTETQTQSKAFLHGNNEAFLFLNIISVGSKKVKSKIENIDPGHVSTAFLLSHAQVRLGY